MDVQSFELQTNALTLVMLIQQMQVLYKTNIIRYLLNLLIIIMDIGTHRQFDNCF